MFAFVRSRRCAPKCCASGWRPGALSGWGPGARSSTWRTSDRRASKVHPRHAHAASALGRGGFEGVGEVVQGPEHAGWGGTWGGGWMSETRISKQLQSPTPSRPRTPNPRQGSPPPPRPNPNLWASPSPPMRGSSATSRTPQSPSPTRRRLTPDHNPPAQTHPRRQAGSHSPKGQSRLGRNTPWRGNSVGAVGGWSVSEGGGCGDVG